MRSDSEVSGSGDDFPFTVADRVKQLPPYMFGRINKMKDQKRAAGVDVIDLGMGNPTDAPDPKITQTLIDSLADPQNHRYSVSNGIEDLRKAVSARYKRKYNVDLDAETEVLACIGSKEGFSHMCLATMGPGDSAIVPAPYFPIHVHAVALASGNAIAIDCRDPESFLTNIAYSCEHLYPKPKLVVVNFPHNPTSTVVEQEFYDDLVKLAKKYGFFVISDFAYADICFDGYQAPSFLSSPGAKEVGVEMTTMSKGFSMAGWRVGFCAGNEKMVEALGKIKGYYDYGLFQAVQVASIVAMDQCEAAVEDIVKVYQERRDVLCNGLNSNGWEIEAPKGTMFVWAKIPEPWVQMGSLEFSLQLLDNVGVAVSPGIGFGEMGDQYLRLAIVESSERLQSAVDRMGEWMSSKPA